jgi:hypothetical protein
MHMMDDLQLRHAFTAKDPIYISYSLSFILSMQLILIGTESVIIFDK